MMYSANNMRPVSNTTQSSQMNGAPTKPNSMAVTPPSAQRYRHSTRRSRRMKPVVMIVSEKALCGPCPSPVRLTFSEPNPDRSLMRMVNLAVLARQKIGSKNRYERDGDDQHRDDIGHRPLPWPDELGQHPDRQRRLLSGRERRDDDLVERQ